MARIYPERSDEFWRDPRLSAEALMHAPGFTLRGGTTEVLRGVIARGMGLR